MSVAWNVETTSFEMSTCIIAPKTPSVQLDKLTRNNAYLSPFLGRLGVPFPVRPGHDYTKLLPRVPSCSLIVNYRLLGDTYCGSRASRL